MRLAATTALVTGLLALGACQAQPAAAPAAGAAADEAALLARIRSAVGDARCSADAQCRTLPIGEKACGGPQSWLAWSTSSLQADKLPGWATELAALARARNAQSGMMSTCQYMPDPGAVCQAQRCVLGTPALAR
jgi:hypothetical protein